MSSVMNCNNLTKEYKGKKALDGLTFSIEENKIVGLIGRNGAGKTTFLKACTGYIKPTSGEIKIFGKRPFDNIEVLSEMIFIDEEIQYNDALRLTDILDIGKMFYHNWNGIFAINATVILLLTSIVFFIESILFKTLAGIYPSFIYSNTVTLQAFFAGFWISLCWIMFFTVLTYSIFTLFTGYKHVGITSFALIIGLLFIFPIGRKALFSALMFFVGEQSMPLLSIKLLLSTIAIQCLSYIVMKRMEVIF